MLGAFQQASLCALAALLVTAAISDVRRFIIPNWLNAAVAALAIPYWLGSGEPLWPLLAWQLGLALVVLAVFAGLFAIGAMGGGDVKLFAALALWLPWAVFLQMMMLVAIAGGLLTAGLLIAHRIRKREGKLEVPYGLAISIGALTIFAEPIVKHFTP